MNKTHGQMFYEVLLDNLRDDSRPQWALLSHDERRAYDTAAEVTANRALQGESNEVSH